MRGNSKRRGAVRRPGSKKGPTKGTGGKNRRALEGRGPTPKAEDRPYHPAAKRKAESERRSQAAPQKPARASAAQEAGGTGAAKKQAEHVIGRNSVVEALRANVPAIRLDIAQGIEMDERVREALDLAGARGVEIAQVTKRELDARLGAVHQGVALRVAPYQYASVRDLLARADQAGTPALIVALDQVTDPHNLGASLRSAAAFGAHGVLIPERRSAQMGATAWKVSAGAAARVPVARATNLVAALELCKQEGAFVVGLDAQGVADADRLDLATGPLVVVVGSEGKGLARLTREACDLTVAVPIDAATESLNAAVAVGIVLYEVAKQRRAAPLPKRP
ncbi:MAG: 23S rRNA (guanosine(2251)-2'-O)-methyltransferase RlmB [Bifidobacteriaceae bacterium]|jgi:23S rRNA (guanosine2251-2'-O)-methyltransferase|nr:23S rRNA (guanosine(2251)-2'-O)-methyltransferase RlmB [Bifidobacteriaceae bacterium]